MMKELPLTNGGCALVDDEDYEQLSSIKWWSHKGKRTRYVERRVGKDHQLLHRFIMTPPEGMEIDHINGDGLDNRRCNLRIVTCRGNGQNRHQEKSSKYPGVCKNSGRGKKWRSYIMIEGKWKHLGFFDKEEDAHNAYIGACSLIEAIE